MFSIIRLELMRLHLRTKKIWKALISLFITFMLVIFFAAYILASKETSIKVLYNLSKLERPNEYGSAIDEAIKFIKHGRIGNIYQIIIVITVIMIIITLFTKVEFMKKTIKKCYHKWLVNPYFGSNVSEFSTTIADNSILENIDLNVLKLTTSKNKIIGKCNNATFEQTDVIDINKDYFGRILSVKGIDSGINVLLVNNVLNNCMKVQSELYSVDAEILEGFYVYADNEESANAFMESESNNNIIDFCKQFGSVAIHINGDEIIVLYDIARDTFNIDMAKRFKYNIEMAKIRNDVNFIKNVCSLFN